MKALVLLGPGTNRDRDAVEAIEAAGGEAFVVPMSLVDARSFRDCGMLVIPGGFSYGDALGAGTLLALDLERRFADEVGAFVDSGRPVIGICNGFQALVKSGILPGDSRSGSGEDRVGLLPRERQITLARNERGDFECRWVRLSAPPSRSGWTSGLGDLACPVAHGEGRIAGSRVVLERVTEEGLVAFRYVGPDGLPASGAWPANPNGSALDIAGLCNEAGNVLGLMPHPENAIRPRARSGALPDNHLTAIKLFRNGIKMAG